MRDSTCLNFFFSFLFHNGIYILLFISLIADCLLLFFFAVSGSHALIFFRLGFLLYFDFLFLRFLRWRFFSRSFLWQNRFLFFGRRDRLRGLNRFA